jgi:hypothetical protein
VTEIGNKDGMESPTKNVSLAHFPNSNMSLDVQLVESVKDKQDIVEARQNILMSQEEVGGSEIKVVDEHAEELMRINAGMNDSQIHLIEPAPVTKTPGDHLQSLIMLDSEPL